VAIVIDNVPFKISPADLVLQGGLDPDTGLCLIGIQDSASHGGPNILGDTFLTNVVTLFDLQNYQVKITQQA
jgi:hypothetical protein